MMNNKGFTLTEVLLAAMIVGIIGIALAALTTAALRESSVGRTRLTLRNQASLFLRQLRQDVREADSLKITQNGHKLTIGKQRFGPNMLGVTLSITYDCSQNSVCKRESDEIVLNHVQTYGDGKWAAQFRVVADSILQVNLIVGVDSEPPIKEAIETTIVAPRGFAVADE